MARYYTMKYFYKGFFHVYQTTSLKHALRKFARLSKNSQVKRLEMEVSYSDWRKANFQNQEKSWFKRSSNNTNGQNDFIKNRFWRPSFYGNLQRQDNNHKGINQK